MAQVVFLSEAVIFGELGSSRYMGPYVLASLLEAQGFSTVVIDYFTKIENFFDFLDPFLDEGTLIVGISSTFLSPPLKYFSGTNNRHEGTELYNSGILWCADEESWMLWSQTLQTLLRKKSPKARIILGGTKAMAFFHRPHLAQHLDYLGLAAGDHSIVEAAQALQQNQEPAHTIHKGIRVLNNAVLKNQLENCPVTNYQPRWAIQPKESLPIEISRGCIFNCKFCYYERKSSLRKSTEAIIAEMTRNYEMFGTTVYHFCDDCFNDSRAKVETICNAILKLPFKIEWISYARFDVAVKFPETMDLMIDSGASSLYWGIESFHAETARKAGKGTPPEKIKQFLIDSKKKFGDRCFLFGSFITGLPGEPEDSLRETVEWLTTHDALHAVGFGPLSLSPYNEKLDQKTVDYADYSRNPEKYGFKKISHDLQTWEHDLMTGQRAAELATWANQEWLNKKGAGLFAFAWQYVHYRTLGFSKADIFDRFLNNDLKHSLLSEVEKANLAFMAGYWADLVVANKSRTR